MEKSVNDDTIHHYLGRKAEWVARCGFHQVERGNERFTDNDAAGLIEFVWEFCEASCVAANATVPQKKQEAVVLLWALLASGQITMRKVDGWQTLAQPIEPMKLDLVA